MAVGADSEKRDDSTAVELGPTASDNADNQLGESPVEPEGDKSTQRSSVSSTQLEKTAECDHDTVLTSS